MHYDLATAIYLIGDKKLLGLTIDSKLNFNNHLQKILKKANKKVHVLATITSYMSTPKRKLLMNLSSCHNLITALLCGCAIVV